MSKSEVTIEMLNNSIQNLNNNIIGTVNNLQNNQNFLHQELNNINSPLKLPALFNVQTILSAFVQKSHSNFNLSHITNILSQNSDFLKDINFLTSKLISQYYTYIYITSKNTHNFMSFYLHPTLPIDINVYGPNSTVSDDVQATLRNLNNLIIRDKVLEVLNHVEYVFPPGAPPKKAFVFPINIINDTGISGGEDLVLVFGCGY